MKHISEYHIGRVEVIDDSGMMRILVIRMMSDEDDEDNFNY